MEAAAKVQEDKKRTMAESINKTVFDLFNSSIATPLIHLVANGTFSEKDFNTWKDSLRGALSGTPVTTSVSIVSGTASFRRFEKITYLEVDTENNTSSDQLDEIDGVNQKDWDLVILTPPQNNARTITIRDFNTTTKNIFIQTKEFEMIKQNSGAIYCLLLLFLNGQYLEIGRYPYAYPTDVAWNAERSIVDTVTVSSGTATLQYSNTILLGEITGETAATADYTLNAAPPDVYPATGNITVSVDEGAASFEIANVNFTGVASETALQTLVETAINAGPYYSAVRTGAKLDITAPAGRGATANTYLINVSISTTVGTVSILSQNNFGGGINGANSTDTITNIDTTFFEIPEGQEVLLTLQNGMSSGKFLKFADTGNINREGYLNGGDSIKAVADSSGNVKLVGSAGAGKAEYIFQGYDMYSSGGTTLYGVAVTASSDQVTTGVTYLGNPVRVFNDAVDEYAVMLTRVPDNYATGFDVTVELVYSTPATTGDNWVLYVGGTEVSTTGGTLGSYTDLAASPYTISTAGSEVEIETLTYTFPYGSGAAEFLFEAGKMFSIGIVREGTNGSDSLTDDIYIHYLRVVFPVTN